MALLSAQLRFAIPHDRAAGVRRFVLLVDKGKRAFLKAGRPLPDDRSDVPNAIHSGDIDDHAPRAQHHAESGLLMHGPAPGQRAAQARARCPASRWGAGLVGRPPLA